MSNREPPKIGTQIASEILGHFLGVPPGEAGESFTQLLQMGRDAVPVAMEEFVKATPAELRPPVLAAYKDENGEIKWGYFPRQELEGKN